MKIEDLLFLPHAPVRKQNPASGEENFAGCLQEAVAANQKGGLSQAAAGVESMAEISPADDLVQASAELADASLARLELFQGSLARPELTLKHLAPLVNSLAEDSRRLQSLAQELPQGSPLRQLLEEVAALSLVESTKFHRGDYL